MRTEQTAPQHPPAARPGPVARRLPLRPGHPRILIPLLMMAVVGTLAYEFQVSLPLLARYTFGGDAGTYGTMTALMGAGAVVGGLLTAAARRRSPTALASMALLFGAVQGLPPSLPPGPWRWPPWCRWEPPPLPSWLWATPPCSWRRPPRCAAG